METNYNNTCELKIKLHIDKVPFPQKPEGFQIGGIRNRLNNMAAGEYTLGEICESIQRGQTICPGVLVGGSIKDNWTQQQLFCVDIDNDIEDKMTISPDKALEICDMNLIKPAFIYYSFSHSEFKDKFRIGFVADEVVTSLPKRNIIMQALMDLFPQRDSVCSDENRLFFGTNKGLYYFDSNARFTYDDIVRISEKLIDPPTVEKIYTDYNDKINLVSEIEKFDFLGYLTQVCGEISHEGSRYIMFRSCPICGGHEDLVFYHDTKMFTCFGKYGRKSGNIINFLMLTKNLSKKEAVEYFLYDMLGYTKPVKNTTQQVIQTVSTVAVINENIQLILDNFYKLSNPPETFSRDDKGMSELFAKTVKDFLRHNADRNAWMQYNGKVWVNDTGSNTVNKWAKHFRDGLLIYSCSESLYSDILDPQQKSRAITEFQKFITSLGSKNKRDIMVKDAQSEYPIYNNDLDSKIDLFNCQNGTLNLKTLEFKEHDPNDMLSKLANVVYDPNANSDIFQKFIKEVLENDIEKIKFLQRALGYSLTAETKEETMFILYGPSSRNGKSTLNETTMNTLGDYAKQANPETFAVKKFNDSRIANGDVSRLRSTRYVSVSELPRNMILNTAFVKTMTGGDTITARELYERESQYKPQFKIFINTNYLPQVNDTTLFESGRVNVIRFNRHFSVEEQDRNLKSKLSEESTKSGLLNWCLEGLKEYRAQGLNPPECIINANTQYQILSDNIGRCLNECFIESINSTTLAAAYQVYCDWCQENDLIADTKRLFNARLQNLGITATINGQRNMLKCLEVRTDNPF